MVVAERARWIDLVVLLIVCGAGVLLVSLVSWFSIWNYPFYFPDSYDWIANGLRYSNLMIEPFPISHRAMLLPLFIALLFNYGLENWIIYFGIFWYIAGGLLLYFGLKKILDRTVAAVATVFYLSSFSVIGQSFYVGADIAANSLLILFSLLWFEYLRTSRTRTVVYLALVAGVWVHTQYLLAIILPALLLSLFVSDKGFSYSRICCRKSYQDGLCFILVSLLVAVIILYPRLREFQIIYTENVEHTSLVSFSLDSLAYYFLGLPASFSWLTCLLASMGIVIALRKEEYRAFGIFLILLFLNIFLFFSVLYTWKDVRFILYLALPVFIFAALGLITCFSWLRRRFTQISSWCFSSLVLYYNSATPTLDAFDLNFALTPLKSVTFHLGSGFTGAKEKAITTEEGFLTPVFCLLESSIAEARSGFREQSEKTLLHKIFREVRFYIEQKHAKKEELPIVVYYEGMPSYEHYWKKNRSILYLGSAVTTVTGREELASVARLRQTILVVSKAEWESTVASGQGNPSCSALLKNEFYLALLCQPG